MSRFVAFANERGACKHSFALPDPLMIAVSDLTPGVQIRHPIERFRRGHRVALNWLREWCEDRGIQVHSIHRDIFREEDILNDPHARANRFPADWVVIRFATAQDAMMFKLSWVF